MTTPRIAKSELQLLEKLWELGQASVREVYESLSVDSRPAYTTVQTMISRLEQKGAVKRVKKIGSAHIFEAAFSKRRVQRRLVNDLLDLFGGSAAPVMSHLIEAGKLNLADLKKAEKFLNEMEERK